jgi:hypothetical protein
MAFKAIHLGRKPKRGGSPPIDKRRKVRLNRRRVIFPKENIWGKKFILRYIKGIIKEIVKIE